MRGYSGFAELIFPSSCLAQQPVAAPQRGGPRPVCQKRKRECTAEKARRSRQHCCPPLEIEQGSGHQLRNLCCHKVTRRWALRSCWRETPLAAETGRGL